MKVILTCRNPHSLEDVIEILYQSGYAYYVVNNQQINTYNKTQPKLSITKTIPNNTQYNYQST